MLPRSLVKSFWVPTARLTSFAGPLKLVASAAGQRPVAFPCPTPKPPQAQMSCNGMKASVVCDPADKVMPTPFVDSEKLQDKDCGTGQPGQRGNRKTIVHKRRHPWFTRQWTLDMKRITKGPETPHFPDGVPFTQIRKLQSFAGRSFQINAGRRRKIRLSLKRGRRKLL